MDRFSLLSGGGGSNKAIQSCLLVSCVLFSVLRFRRFLIHIVFNAALPQRRCDRDFKDILTTVSSRLKSPYFRYEWALLGAFLCPPRKRDLEHKRRELRKVKRIVKSPTGASGHKNEVAYVGAHSGSLGADFGL